MNHTDCLPKHCFLLFLLLLPFAHRSSAQQLPYNRYSIKDGLTTNAVYELAEDEHGFLWVGTYEGLLRYDGNHFENLTGDSKILQSRFGGLHARHDSIFAVAAAGIAILHHGKREEYFYPDNLVEDFRFVYTSVLHKNKIYVKSSSTANLIFDLTTKQFSPNHWVLHPEIADRISGWEVYDTDGDQFRIHVQVRNDKGENAALLNRIFCVENDTIYPSDKHWDLFPSSNYKIIIPELHEMLIEKVPSLTDALIQVEFKDSFGNIWVGTEQGLYQIATLAMEHFTSDDGMPNLVWAIVQDAQKNMWFGSWGEGLAKYDGKKFTPVKVETHSGDTIRSYYMGAVPTEQGFLMPYSGGVIENQSDKISQLDIPDDGYLYIYNDTLENRQFFAGVSQLVVREPDTLKVFPHQEHGAHLPLAIIKDKKGRYWMGNSKTFIFKNDQYVDVDADEMPMNEGFLCAEKDNRGNLWFARKNILVYKYQSVDTIALPELADVMFLKNYRDSVMIVGCKLGLGIIDLNRYYDQKSNYFRFIGEEEGFRGEMCGQNGCFIDADNEIWFTTSQNVSKIDLSKIMLNDKQPNSYFKGINTADNNLQWQEQLLSHCPSDSVIELHYPICNVQIAFDAISLKYSNAIQFRYRLEGYTDSWSPLGKDRSATYTNLAPGKYTFSIQAVNPLYESAPITRQLSFWVKPALWQIWWVQLLLIIALLSLISWLLSIYFSRKRKRLLQLQSSQQEIINLQLTNIKSQLSPHFIFNALNSVGADLLLNQAIAYTYLSKISHLIRETISHSEVLVKTLGEELDFVERFLELQKYRFGDRLNYDIIINKQVDTQILIPKMAIQILVENALVHGLGKKENGGELFLHVLEDAECVVILVRDNGVGFDSEKVNLSSGTGLKNIKRILRIYNRYNESEARLTITSKVGRGTLVRLYIPMRYCFEISTKKMK
ncbi:MAG: two-component regulator propeller domain-containing protein [Mangrovibacterium sp.]